MPVPVKIPSPLRPFAGGQAVIQVEATSVEGLLAALAGNAGQELVVLARPREHGLELARRFRDQLGAARNFHARLLDQRLDLARGLRG